MLTDGARYLAEVQPHLKQYHTRAMRAPWKETINSTTTLSPAIHEFIYTTPTSQISLDLNRGIYYINYTAFIKSHVWPDMNIKLTFVRLTKVDLQPLIPISLILRRRLNQLLLQMIAEMETCTSQNGSRLNHYGVKQVENVQKAQKYHPWTWFAYSWHPEISIAMQPWILLPEYLQYKIQVRQLRAQHCATQFLYLR